MLKTALKASLSVEHSKLKQKQARRLECSRPPGQRPRLAGPLRESLEQRRIAIPKRQCRAKIIVLIVGEPSYYWGWYPLRNHLSHVSRSQVPSLGGDGRTYEYL